jgi:hypothetical protein
MLVACAFELADKTVQVFFLHPKARDARAKGLFATAEKDVGYPHSTTFLNRSDDLVDRTSARSNVFVSGTHQRQNCVVDDDPASLIQLCRLPTGWLRGRPS